MDDMQFADLAESLRQGTTIVERRRPGRVEYTNPALLELLSHPAADPAEHDAPASTRYAKPAARPVAGARGFVLTQFESLRPQPGTPRNRTALQAGPCAAPIAIDVAQAERLCRDDRHSVAWTRLLAAEVAKIHVFIAGSDYPSQAPTRDSVNAAVATLVSLCRPVRRMCLISGRDGTPQANQAVAQAIASLGCRSRIPGEYAYWSALRAFCASLCFYWAVAGAIVRHDFATGRVFMHTTIARNGAEQPAVSALPLLALGSFDWKILKGLEARRTPASDFLFSLFKADIANLALDPNETDEDLFDRLEFLVSLEFSHMRLQRIAQDPTWFWVPLGRYVCNGRTMPDRLVAHERLATDHPLLKAGLLGGTPESAAQAARAMRRRFDNSQPCGRPATDA